MDWCRSLVVGKEKKQILPRFAAPSSRNNKLKTIVVYWASMKRTFTWVRTATLRPFTV